MAAIPPMDEILRLRRGAKPDTFETYHNPVRMGNTAPIAYGGCTLAAAVMAAFFTVTGTPIKALYSFTGSYLGPARIDRPLQMSVSVLRETRTFSTRFVSVTQTMDDGSTRTCLTATADFIAAPAEADSDAISLLRYSATPRCKHEHYSELLDSDTVIDQRLAAKELNPKLASIYRTVFGLWVKQFETRFCADSLTGQTLNGIDKKRQTTQETLPIFGKSSSQWVRSRISLKRAAEEARDRVDELVPSEMALNAATLIFALDGALSFIPLTFSHRFLDDAGACSSLDFAVRCFVDRPSIENWLYQEHHTTAAGFGRTYSEGRVWDERGVLVANMTQASIMRPPARALALIINPTRPLTCVSAQSKL